MKNDKAIAVFSFTREANRLNRCVQEKLSDCGYLCEGYTTSRLEGTWDLKAPDTDIKAWIGRQWGKKDFLFIGAAGIAVRYIAPWVRDKYTDSAVLVMDEKGEYVIPLLSGHMGGAVEIAREIERSVHAAAVITTATDVRKKFAVDVFAKDNRLRITDRSLVTKISAAELEDTPVGFYSELPAEDPLPSGLVRCACMEELHGFTYGIAVVEYAEEGMYGDHILILEPSGSGRVAAGGERRSGRSRRRCQRCSGSMGLISVTLRSWQALTLRRKSPVSWNLLRSITFLSIRTRLQGSKRFRAGWRVLALSWRSQEWIMCVNGRRGAVCRREGCCSQRESWTE